MTKTALAAIVLGAIAVTQHPAASASAVNQFVGGVLTFTEELGVQDQQDPRRGR